MEGISRRELARRQGISESAVRRHLAASGVLAGAVLADGSLDAAKATEALSGVVSHAKVVPVALANARTRRLRVQVAKLTDEVAILRATTITPDAAATVLAGQVAIVMRHLLSIPDAATKLAGLPAAEVRPALRDILFDALEANVADDGQEDEGEWWNERSHPVQDLDRLTPNALLARKIDLGAAKLEVEHALAHGHLRAVEDVVNDFGERLAVAKSMLFALPARVASAFEEATPEEVRALVSAEIDEAISAL